ncbi:MAG: hypothetical protein ACOVO9_11765 [Bacteroidia bacterium]
MKQLFKILFLCLPFFGLAQEKMKTDTTLSNIPMLEKNKGGQLGFSLKAGTMGVGAEFAKNLNAKRTISLRLGGTYLPVTYNGLELDVAGSTITADISGNLGNGFLMFDFHPFGNAFKFTLGGAMMLTKLNGDARMKDSIKQGEIIIAPEKVGLINASITHEPFAPYVGIGFGRAIPKNRIGFSFEIGTYYTGAPKLDFVTTGLLEPTSDQEPVLQKGISVYEWMPQMMFNITFKLAK